MLIVKLLNSVLGPTHSPAPAQPVGEQEDRPLERYLVAAVRRSRAFTARGESVVVDYLSNFGQLPGAELNEPQLRAKGGADASLNIRAAELLRAPLSPRRPLTDFAGELHRSALLQKARYDAVVRMRAFCTEMVLTLAPTGDECAWCRATAGKRFPVTADPNEVLARECSCTPYSTATFYPVAKQLEPKPPGARP